MERSEAVCGLNEVEQVSAREKLLAEEADVRGCADLAFEESTVIGT
jgi:hypothetical protein